MTRRTVEDIARSLTFGPSALSRTSIERCIEAWEGLVENARKHDYPVSRLTRQNIKAGKLALELLDENQGEIN